MSIKTRLKIMTLAGGPDREREVSLNSGANVTRALRSVGHDVITGDILSDDLSMIDEFTRWHGDLIFPVLHGCWGEGGGLQKILDGRMLPYVGSNAKAASLCMDKHRTKQSLVYHDIATPRFEYLSHSEARTLELPLVVKANSEGSSIDLAICHTQEEFDKARETLAATHEHLLVEQFIQGKELTVGIIALDNDANVLPGLVSYADHQALPAIHIIPATSFYDYKAKYTREDTQYRFDIDLPGATLKRVSELALQAHAVLGCRHLSRVDFMVDENHQPWILEVNTIPGFTSHSLLPMAANKAGLDLPALVDHLARTAMHDRLPT